MSVPSTVSLYEESNEMMINILSIRSHESHIPARMRVLKKPAFAWLVLPLSMMATLFTVVTQLPSMNATAFLMKTNRWSIVELSALQNEIATPLPTPRPVESQVKTISQLVQRLDQSDLAQYANQKEHDQWWESTCSVASIAEIINAYQQKHYRITDVLGIAASFTNPQVISPSQGLLYPEGIARTMAYLGFATTPLSHATIDQIIKVANEGTPVLVNFPPARWSGGHFVVVKGGTRDQIEIVDSSRINLQTLTHQRFAELWAGFALTFAPTRYSVLGRPSLTVSFMEQVLAAYHSPVAGQAQALSDLGVRYSVDPAFTLAIFLHESVLGTQGVARDSRSPGNLRCVTTGYEDLGPWCKDNYAYFPSWIAGFEALYRLLSGPVYAASGLVTPEQIIPKYAPAADSNKPDTYIARLKQALDSWHKGEIIVH